MEKTGTKTLIFWHTLTEPELKKELSTDFVSGLSKEEASTRLLSFGQNAIPEGKREPLWKIFVEQFQSSLIYILLISSVVVFLMGDTADGILILLVLVFNAAIGTVQEGRSENALAALKKLTQTSTTVVRNGKETVLTSSEVVPGDIVLLEEGEKVSADMRIVESENLHADEAALTGESVPVSKTNEPETKKSLSPADQKNMLFMGTVITAGSGKAVVVKTGLNTEIGIISKKISSIDTEIPLKANIRRLSQLVIYLILSLSAIIILTGVFFNDISFRELFKISVSLAVSAIPEGLPVVLTLILASGVWRMSKTNVLVKKLQAVEALGQAKIIAVDKTGTITKNEMLVRHVFINGKTFRVEGSGYEPKGEIRLEKDIIEPLNHPELLLAGRVATIASKARVAVSENNDWKKVSGDPTEAAILVLGEKIGFNREDLQKEYPLLDETPFDYRNRYRAVLNKFENKKILSIIGAPENILTLSSKIYEDGKIVPLTKSKIDSVNEKLKEMSQSGLRVVGFAIRESVKEEKISSQSVTNLTFLGFYGIEDSLRPEVKKAVDLARSSGIRVIMITGDHKLTALAIAKEADIWKEGDMVVTGEEINTLSETEIDKLLDRATVFARFTPDDKMKIIEGYRRRGEVIAMTGDGVNDAPSLIAADLGVAMGKIGTEVAKEASDIILLDDNFGNIIKAAEEGRSIYRTIRKVIMYLFSTNLSEVIIITFAIFAGLPLPIVASQIIWLNLITDGFLTVAMAQEPKESNLLLKPIKKTPKYLISGAMSYRMGTMAIVMAIGSLILFNYFEQDGELVRAQTITLTAMAVFQWLNAWNCRSEEKSIFSKGMFSNKYLIGGTFLIAFLQILAVYNPFLQKILHTSAINSQEWLLAIGVALSVVIVEEIRKFFVRAQLKTSS